MDSIQELERVGRTGHVAYAMGVSSSSDLDPNTLDSLKSSQIRLHVKH